MVKRRFDGIESKIMTIEYKVLEECKEWEIKQKNKIEEQMTINIKLGQYVKVADAFSIPEFQYPLLDLKLCSKEEVAAHIPKHDATNCVWVDTEKILAEMASTILKSHRAIGVDSEYHELEKVRNCSQGIECCYYLFAANFNTRLRLRHRLPYVARNYS